MVPKWDTLQSSRPSSSARVTGARPRRSLQFKSFGEHERNDASSAQIDESSNGWDDADQLARARPRAAGGPASPRGAQLAAPGQSANSRGAEGEPFGLALSQTGEGSRAPELQRSAEDLPRDGVTREEIISMIESEDFEKADRTWEREETRRRDLRVPTYHDSLAIGRAFLQQAVRLREKKHPEQASEAAAFADKCARFAVADLELHGQPPNEANALAQAARAFEHGGSDLSSRSSR